MIRRCFILFILICISSLVFSQEKTTYVWPIDGQSISFTIPSHIKDGQSLYFLSEPNSLNLSEFLYTEIDFNTLVERRSGLQNHTSPIVENNIRLPLSVQFQDMENLYAFYIDEYVQWRSPHNRDPRVIIFAPVSIVKTPKSDLESPYVKELRKDSLYFCPGSLECISFLEDQGIFYAFGNAIHENKVMLLSENPGQGFKHMHPCWYIFDTEGNVLDYELIGEDDLYFSGKYLHYEQEENKIYALGGTLDKERFPLDYDFNGILAVFDLETRSFDRVFRYSESQDSLFGARAVKWNDGEFLVNGIIGWNFYESSIDSLHFPGAFENAGGVLRFDGNHSIKTYTNSNNRDGRFAANHVIYEDTDTSFFLARNVPIENRALTDTEHIWLTRMSKDGPPLDTIRIAHDLPDIYDIWFDGGFVDSIDQNLYIWGAYAIDRPRLPLPYYLFVFKMDLEEVKKLYTALNENDLEVLDNHESLIVYPTVFESKISLFNRDSNGKVGSFKLFGANGALVFSEDIDLVSKEFITLETPVDLVSGSYFYTIDLEQSSYNGVMIKN